MTARRASCLLLAGMIAAALPDTAVHGQTNLAITSVITSTTPEPAEKNSSREAVISTSCAMAIAAAASSLQRDFSLAQPSSGTQQVFDDLFLRQYGSVMCYEDGDGFILYFRPPGQTGANMAGAYLFRMARDHAIQYAAPMR